MRVLGIDTATSIASVALIEDGKLVREQTHPEGGSTSLSTIARPKANHAEIILPLIESVLDQAQWSLDDVTGIAVSVGPGSFTGLRIGLSTVKGLAYGWDIPVVGISTLLANAARVTDFEGPICSFLDARKNEVYTSLFRSQGGDLTRLTDDRVVPVKEVLELILKFNEESSWLFVGDGAKAYEKLLIDSLGDRIQLRVGDSCASVASAVGRLGAARLGRSEFDNLGSLVPIYLRLSEAETRRRDLP